MTMSCEVKLDGQTCCLVRLANRCTVTVQPAGPAGERRIFLSVLVENGNDSSQHIELVLQEGAARELGEALISGSVGIMREFDLVNGKQQ
jgi:hypothetical protein